MSVKYNGVLQKYLKKSYDDIINIAYLLYRVYLGRILSHDLCTI